MKRTKILCLALAALALLGGCASAAEDEQTDTAASPKQTSAPQTTLAPETTPAPGAASAKTAEKPESYDLSSVPFEKLTNGKLSLADGVDELIWFNSNLSDYGLRYSSPDELIVTGLLPYYRVSTRQMGENALSSSKQAFTLSAGYEDNTNERWFDQTVIHIGEMTDRSIPVESADALCTLSGTRTVRGFIKPASGSKAQFVIDPAFMGDIPLFSSRDEDLTFDINGETLYADSLLVTCENEEIVKQLKSELGEGVNDYVYAQFDITWLHIPYNSASGYRGCDASIENLTVLTKDTSSVISGDFLFGQDERGNSDADKLYSLLAENLDTLYTIRTVGVTLLDMDFDGTAEVIVSGGNVNESGGTNFIDSDVYSTANGQLTLLGTIESIAERSYFASRGSSAYLGLKELPDGQKAWLAITDEYLIDEEKGGLLEKWELITLQNGKLSSEDILSVFADDNSQFNIYIDGKLTKPTASGNNDSLTLETPWGSVSGYGDYDIYMNLKNMYCSDIEQSFFLYNDLFVAMGTEGDLRDVEGTKLMPSERDVRMELAFLTDAYFDGTYSEKYGGYSYDFQMAAALKPIIYLYPEERTEVSVNVDFPNGGNITCSYPEYGKGWKVSALPDGTLYDKNGNEYYALYWEGENLPLAAMDEGWCVPGKDTAEFLREKLTKIGLTAREANEFIIYWLPQMQENPYNIISFHFEDYCRAAPLTVSPAPDTSIRVFMTFVPVGEFTEIAPQELPEYERHGFTLVEWGGCELAK